jgi:hypothetical protein
LRLVDSRAAWTDGMVPPAGRRPGTALKANDRPAQGGIMNVTAVAIESKPRSISLRPSRLEDPLLSSKITIPTPVIAA